MPSRPLLVLATLALALAACPPNMDATRDGGTTCTSTSECNNGTSCGQIYLCVNNYCSMTTTVIACRDAEPAEAAPVGNCLTYEDCNPAGACGLLIDCINIQCDPSAPRISVPCDGEGVDVATDATDTAHDAPRDAAGEADVDASTDGPVRDVAVPPDF